MKIPSGMNNGCYGYGDTYLSDGTGSESVTPANSNSIDDCDSPSVDGDFSEYLWMENEEEFDKQVRFSYFAATVVHGFGLLCIYEVCGGYR